MNKYVDACADFGRGLIRKGVGWMASSDNAAGRARAQPAEGKGPTWKAQLPANRAGSVYPKGPSFHEGALWFINPENVGGHFAIAQVNS